MYKKKIYSNFFPHPHQNATRVLGPAYSFLSRFNDSLHLKTISWAPPQPPVVTTTTVPLSLLYNIIIIYKSITVILSTYISNICTHEAEAYILLLYNYYNYCYRCYTHTTTIL